MATGDPVDVVERVLQILDDGSFTTTYKFAVLLGLVELCFEQGRREGAEPTTAMVTTRQLADKVLALYWPQVRPHPASPEGLLRQGNARPGAVGGRTIPVLIDEWQRAHGAGAGLPYMRARSMPAFGALWDAVERVLIKMPLPKLQRLGGGEALRLLYTIGWNDSDSLPSDARITRYQRGEPTDFDNRIQLLPGVSEAFARLAPLLRSFIQQRWVEKVAALNPGENVATDLGQHLFGVDRIALGPVTRPLVALQGGCCFYCGRPLAGEVHIDHFLPWSRFPDNGLANLVAADARCNGAKRDFLADAPHLTDWQARLSAQAPVLTQIGREIAWDVGAERSRGAARSLYLALPENGRVWLQRDGLVTPDRGALLRLVGA